MQKLVYTCPSNPNLSNEETYQYIEWQLGEAFMSELKARLLTIVEGIGLPERQEKAVKTLVDTTLYRSLNDTLGRFKWYNYEDDNTPETVGSSAVNPNAGTREPHLLANSI